MAISDGLAALVAGNAVLLKPDQQTPLVALAAVELLHASAGCRAGPVAGGATARAAWSVRQVIDVSRLRLLHRIHRDRAEGGRPVRRAADRLLAGAGRQEPAAGAGRRRPRGRAAEGAVRACFSNAGQLCVAAERIYVAESVREAFTAAFVRRTEALRLGTALDYEHDMAGLINSDQLERVERPRRGRPGQGRHRADRRAAPGPTSGALFYEPTVLDRRDPGDGVLRRGDVRAGGQHLPGSRRRRGRRPGERLRVRAERQRLDQRPGARPPGRGPAAVRHGQRQRGVRRHLRQPRRPDGRDEELGAGPPSGPRRASAGSSRCQSDRHPVRVPIAPQPRACRRRGSSPP